MCDYAERYLRTNMTSSVRLGALTVTPAVVLPSNPLRHAIILPIATANTIFWMFADTNTPTRVNGYTSNPPELLLTRDDIGDIITWSFKMWCLSTTINVQFEEISYDPSHYQWYMGCLNDFVANSGS